MDEDEELRLESGLSEVTYSFGGPNQSLGMTDGLQVRWGRLPRGTTLDPSIEASDEKSWVLDLDAFQVKQVELTGDMVETSLNALAHRALRFFRWAVTPEFDKRFGAEQ